jgi:type I restriction enzyme, R subunit
MSEYTEVEQPFLQQPAEPSRTVINQGTGVAQVAVPNLHRNFRALPLRSVFDTVVRTLNCSWDNKPWPTPIS